jgi:hypothetical protein
MAVQLESLSHCGVDFSPDIGTHGAVSEGRGESRVLVAQRIGEVVNDQRFLQSISFAVMRNTTARAS